jgi:hypothetical protein
MQIQGGFAHAGHTCNLANQKKKEKDGDRQVVEGTEIPRGAVAI